MTSSTESTTREIIKVGIDFGTTYTSAAFYRHHVTDGNAGRLPGEVEDRNIHRVIFTSEEAVKSELAWSSDDNRWLWGSEVDDGINNYDLPDSSCIQMIKLGLDSSDHTRCYRNTISRRIEELPDNVRVSEIELITIFLTNLMKYVRTKIEDTLGRIGGASILEGADLEYVFCVPAMWDFKHKQKMVEAISEAGVKITELDLVSEPEAAAISMLHRELRSCAGNSQLVQQRVMGMSPFCVIDIGGGTGVWNALSSEFKANILKQDFITYFVSVAQDGTMQLNEGTMGSGK